MNFAICTPEHISESGSGGSWSMLKLVNSINDRGHHATLALCRDFYANNLNCNPTLPDDCIGIYPEAYRLNPLGTKRIVRWINYYPPNDLSIKDDELVLTYFPPYWRGADQLWTFQYDRWMFRDMGLDRDGTTCYSIRKGGPRWQNKKLDQHPNNAINVDEFVWPSYRNNGVINEKCYVDLAVLFNTCSRFICYDHHTALSDFAAMCGIEVIVIPDGIRSVEKAVEDAPLNLAGQAWGFDDLERANYTRHLLPRLLIKNKQDTDDSIDRLIEKCSHAW